MPRTRSFSVRCEWDQEAKVWFVAESNVPGLSTEAPTQEAMSKKLLVMIPELVSLNDPDGDEEVPLELLYACSTRVRMRDTRQ
jgi:hypothetical protein